MDKPVLTVMLVLALAPALQAGMIYSDGTFNNSDWTTTTFVYGGTPGNVTAGQVGSGGNPGAFRSITNALSGGQSDYAEIDGFHINLSAMYNPGISGAITSLSYSEDAEGIAHSDNISNFDQGTGIALLQAGRFYTAKGVGPGYTFTPNSSGVWQHIEFSGLTADNFQEEGPPFTTNSSRPDFSANGAPIVFGFIRADSSGPTGGSYNAFYVTAGIDNWTVTVEQVPEPSSLTLLGTGLVLLAGLRRVASSHRAQEFKLGSR